MARAVGVINDMAMASGPLLALDETRAYGKLSGLISPLEGLRLSHLASQVDEGVIVEIGSHRGMSACYMAAATEAEIYCIDMWDLPDQDRAGWAKRPDHLKAFREQTQRYPNIHPIRADSRTLEWDKPIGLLFIDGGHTFEAALADYEKYSPHIVRGGAIAFHDCYKDGVIRVIEQAYHSGLWERWAQTMYLVSGVRR